MSKKQRTDLTFSASQKSGTRLSKNYHRIDQETIPKGDEEKDPVEANNMACLPSTSQAGIGSAVLRIGPPQKRKKIAPLPPIIPPSCAPDFVLGQSLEIEDTREAAGSVPPLDLSHSTVRKKRRLKPASDVRPKLPVLVEMGTPSRHATQEPAEPRNEEPLSEINPSPPDHDNEGAEPLPKLTPPTVTRQQIPPDPPVDDGPFPPTPLLAVKNTKKFAPIPKFESSHFKPYLEAADITSVIDEFSPKKLFPTQETVESPVQGSQLRRTATRPCSESFDPMPVDNLFDDDIAQKIQDTEDAYLNLDGLANGIEPPNEEQPTTVSSVRQAILTLFLLTNHRTMILQNVSRLGPSHP